MAGAAAAPGWWGTPPCRLPPAATAALVLAKEGLGRSLAVAAASATAPGKKMPLALGLIRSQST